MATFHRWPGRTTCVGLPIICESGKVAVQSPPPARLNGKHVCRPTTRTSGKMFGKQVPCLGHVLTGPLSVATATWPQVAPPVTLKPLV